jgi:peptidyl-prolyl cis-trans isomerase SurA
LLLLLGLLAAAMTCSRGPSGDREVWAEVDDVPIYRDQVERYYRTRAPSGADQVSQEQALNLKLSILTELINNQVLIAHAAKARLGVSDAEIDTKINELRSPYSPEEFDRKLAEQGLNATSLREEIRQSLMINKLVNKEIASRVSPSDKEIAAYYERNKSQFNLAETQYHLAQIAVTPFAEPQVRNSKNDDAKTGPAAERKITALYARLNAGDDFGTVATEYSEDVRTAPGGGDMGYIAATTVDSSPVMKNAVPALRPGQITGILRSPNGFHIFKLIEKEEAGQRALSDPQVQSSIRQLLSSEREQLLKAAYLDDLRNRAKVVNYLAQKIQNAAGNPDLVQ